MSTLGTTRTGAADSPAVLVSVVIPAYNAAPYIGAALHSVFEQTMTDFEVLLVNDGSPDTPALEQALAPFAGRVRYLRQENRGPSAARNRAIREARGTYIAFLDSDDIWLPEHLARQLELLQSRPELGLVYANAVHLLDEQPAGAAFDSVPQSGPVTFEALLLETCTVNTSSTVASRDALLAVGLFDEQMNRCEDYDLWLRMSRAGVPMAYRQEVQVYHRLSHGLASNRELMKRGRARAYQKIAARDDLSPTQRTMIERKCRDLEAEIQVEIAREALLAGRFPEALAAAEQANVLLPNRKLRWAALGLRYCPGLFRRFYGSYCKGLEAYKRRRSGRWTSAYPRRADFPPSGQMAQ